MDGLLSGDLLVTDLLVTRLACEARKQVSKDKNGKIKVTITTHKPRRARFNVKHDRATSWLRTGCASKAWPERQHSYSCMSMTSAPLQLHRSSWRCQTRWLSARATLPG